MEGYYPGEYDYDDARYYPDSDIDEEYQGDDGDPQELTPDSLPADEYEAWLDEPDYENPGESDGLNDDEYYGYDDGSYYEGE